MTARFIPLIALAACGTAPLVPAARFVNAPVVTSVDDRRDVAAKPDERVSYEKLYVYDSSIQRRLTRAMELPPDRRALGVNALDEVPDSTWFTNRIGVRDYTVDELRAGPAKIETPELHKPWTVKSSKIGGTEIGFIIVDARGEKFLLKFDGEGYPEQETAAHMIVDKLLWACGYHVTEDYIVYFKESELVLPPDARVKDEYGHESKLDRAELERRLRQIEHGSDGRIRGMASRWLRGKPIGGHPAEGTRDDDPNDRIPHELRRDLRGAYAVFAWLEHQDIQASNFLDTWSPDPRNPERHYVEHYLIDFGKSLGVMESTSRDPRRSYEYVIDIGQMTRSLVTAGTAARIWEGREQPRLRGLGMYSPDGFAPNLWKSDFPYVPFLTADRFDKFWAAKIIIRFSRDQLHAVVETARFSDPRTTEYLTDALVKRQRTTARYWFSRVNPLDRFALGDGELCFDDLMLEYNLGPRAADTRYEIASYNRGGGAVGSAIVAHPDAQGHACATQVPIATAADNYTIVRVETTRPGFSGVTFVHVARDPETHALRVIGIWRE